MSKDFEPIPSEILFLKEKIFSYGCHVFFDIDGTIKGSYTPEAPAGFDPKLPYLLATLNDIPGISVGVCTSQSPKELHSFLLRMDSVIDGKLLNGLSVLEDGHILVESGSYMLTDYIKLISPEAKKQIDTLKAELKRLWIPADDTQLAKDGWGFFPGVVTPVALPEGKYQGAVTMSVWERGPDINNPSYQGQYEPVAAFVSQLAQNLGTDLVECKEAGNGTLRIVEQGKSKESALATLANQGIIELKNTVYVGDGLNDIAPAQLVTSHGGGLVAVSNAIPELKVMATYNTKNQFSHGVVETLSLILLS
ncbi:hypothetical protein A2865_01015 [Candidatus Woesebacteria bacterium RIFCSPHIGHO2_01_FULL_39_17]|uniref:HAD-superfamily hydrolase, subfamily IIB n=3 Tax=Candidatus Woeseibacteriota TaxID=1752722 RepID=A0A0G0QVL0_9BACT|nr:MAG: hypothetical protein US72_C0011G0074 [Microgenomates group bacterium GW2011_GWC1_38_12]KKQ94363.1 MAG: hypothetical protein UT19_C0002G0005 [Candidatus Woesebacteria bacterium GW2011_GWB1_39_10b]KKR14375.1 MAG: hypothetical protein UT40_C0001G0005 [Candidatus Woesebacteria bacterium GW2011_GWA1_39_21b]OGM23825.1 MAG: hypothetical protein A2865_01015 [Candidatus Woesebacteria bacterium RIFCSPHIGHO2_01_FULL_39_17]OGM61249.1 MAG: hypothetical protein A3A52_00465 [Candidatus Woesebacteria b